MADKIDRLTIGSTSYDIDLPPDATPSISSLTVSGNVSDGITTKTMTQLLSSGGGTQLYLHELTNSSDDSAYIISTQSTAMIYDTVYGGMPMSVNILACWIYDGNGSINYQAYVIDEQNYGHSGSMFYATELKPIDGLYVSFYFGDTTNDTVTAL